MTESRRTNLTVFALAALLLALGADLFTRGVSTVSAESLMKTSHGVQRDDRIIIRQLSDELLERAIATCQRIYTAVTELAAKAGANEKARDLLIVQSQYDLAMTYYLLGDALKAKDRLQQATSWYERAREVGSALSTHYVRSARAEEDRGGKKVLLGYGKLPEQYLENAGFRRRFNDSLTSGSPDIGAWLDTVQIGQHGAFTHPHTNPQWLMELKPHDSSFRAIGHALKARLNMHAVMRERAGFPAEAIRKAMPAFAQIDPISEEELKDGAQWTVKLYEIGLDRLESFKVESERDGQKPKELVLPYMAGILCEAVLQAYNEIESFKFSDPQLKERIEAARNKTLRIVSKAIDKLGSLWVEADQGYRYANWNFQDPTNTYGAPLLNNMVALPVSQLYSDTREVKYRSHALRLYMGCMNSSEAKSPPLGKQLNEAVGRGLMILQALQPQKVS